MLASRRLGSFADNRGAFGQPICQACAGPELLEEGCDVVAAMAPACRTFDAQHGELADQSADRSIGWHWGSFTPLESA